MLPPQFSIIDFNNRIVKVKYKDFGNSNSLVISMREYLLTPREREILKTYVETGVKLNGFSVLIIRLKRANEKLAEDFRLMQSALEKLKKETTNSPHGG